MHWVSVKEWGKGKEEAQEVLTEKKRSIDVVQACIQGLSLAAGVV